LENVLKKDFQIDSPICIEMKGKLEACIELVESR